MKFQWTRKKICAMWWLSIEAPPTPTTTLQRSGFSWTVFIWHLRLWHRKYRQAEIIEYVVKSEVFFGLPLERSLKNWQSKADTCVKIYYWPFRGRELSEAITLTTKAIEVSRKGKTTKAIKLQFNQISAEKLKSAKRAIKEKVKNDKWLNGSRDRRKSVTQMAASL